MMDVSTMEVTPLAWLLDKSDPDNQPPENWEEIQAEHAEIEAFNARLEEKAERREQRCEMCGRPIHKLDLATGMRKKVVYRCENWHSCAYCREARIEYVRGLLSVVLSEGETWVVRCISDSPTNEAAVAGGKASYLSFPLEKADSQGNDLFIVVDHPVAGSERAELSDLRSWVAQGDLETIACTPEGRRMTGKLRKPAGATAESGQVVRALTFFTEAPDELLDSAYVTAVQRTAGENPQNWQELENACRRRMMVWMQLLREAGFVTVGRYHQEKLNVLKNWELHTFYFLKERGLAPAACPGAAAPEG